MKNSCLRGAICACTLLTFSTVANAALVSRLGGLAVYDTDLDITWLADANLAASNTFGVSGIAPFGNMTWDTANNFIGAMNVDGGTGYLGFDDWRLPDTLVPDSSCTNLDGTPSIDTQGFDCTGSEMGHLFYTEFGAVRASSQVMSGNPAEVGKFYNIMSTFTGTHTGWYWSATNYTPASLPAAHIFDFDFGQQAGYPKDFPAFVWVVRDGDVSAVPVPAAAWLFGSGFISLIGVAGIRKRV